MEAERQPDSRSAVRGRELTPDDLGEIDSAASTIAVQGARYPEYVERMTGH
jgi:hypothetical protein